jgi:hypothetical protein
VRGWAIQLRPSYQLAIKTSPRLAEVNGREEFKELMPQTSLVCRLPGPQGSSCLAEPTILDLSGAIQGRLTRSHHFGWSVLSRDPDIQFTWELFLQVAEVHISLVVNEVRSRRSSSPSNGHPRKATHLRKFSVFGSLQLLHIP